MAEAVGMVGGVALKRWWVIGGGALVGGWCGLYGVCGKGFRVDDREGH